MSWREPSDDGRRSVRAILIAGGCLSIAIVSAMILLGHQSHQPPSGAVIVPTSIPGQLPVDVVSGDMETDIILRSELSSGGNPSTAVVTLRNRSARAIDVRLASRDCGCLQLHGLPMRLDSNATSRFLFTIQILPDTMARDARLKLNILDSDTHVGELEIARHVVIVSDCSFKPSAIRLVVPAAVRKEIDNDVAATFLAILHCRAENASGETPTVIACPDSVSVAFSRTPSVDVVSAGLLRLQWEGAIRIPSETSRDFGDIEAGLVVEFGRGGPRGLLPFRMHRQSE